MMLLGLLLITTGTFWLHPGAGLIWLGLLALGVSANDFLMNHTTEGE